MGGPVMEMSPDWSEAERETAMEIYNNIFIMSDFSNFSNWQRELKSGLGHPHVAVHVIEKIIAEVHPKRKVALISLLNKMLRGYPEVYKKLLQANLPAMFSNVFETADRQNRRLLFKLRRKWSNVLSSEVLLDLDTRVNSIDEGWTFFSSPKFEPRYPPPKNPAAPSPMTSAKPDVVAAERPTFEVKAKEPTPNKLMEKPTARDHEKDNKVISALDNPTTKVPAPRQADANVGNEFDLTIEENSLEKSVTIDGVIWQETSDGLLVLNVTWGGRTYAGVLLDDSNKLLTQRCSPNSPSTNPSTVTPTLRATRSSSSHSETRKSQRIKAKDVTNGSPSKTPGLRRSGLVEANALAAKPGLGGNLKPDLLQATDNGTAKDGQPVSVPIEDNGFDRMIPDQPELPAKRLSPMPFILRCPAPECSKRYRHSKGLEFHISSNHPGLENYIGGKSPGKSGQPEVNDSGTTKCSTTPQHQRAEQKPDLNAEKELTKPSTSAGTLAPAVTSVSKAATPAPVPFWSPRMPAIESKNSGAPIGPENRPSLQPLPAVEPSKMNAEVSKIDQSYRAAVQELEDLMAQAKPSLQPSKGGSESSPEVRKRSLVGRQEQLLQPTGEKQPKMDNPGIDRQAAQRMNQVARKNGTNQPQVKQLEAGGGSIRPTAASSPSASPTVSAMPRMDFWPPPHPFLRGMFLPPPGMFPPGMPGFQGLPGMPGFPGSQSPFYRPPVASSSPRQMSAEPRPGRPQPELRGGHQPQTHEGCGGMPLPPSSDGPFKTTDLRKLVQPQPEPRGQVQIQPQKSSSSQLSERSPYEMLDELFKFVQHKQQK